MCNWWSRPSILHTDSDMGCMCWEIEIARLDIKRNTVCCIGSNYYYKVCILIDCTPHSCQGSLSIHLLKDLYMCQFGKTPSRKLNISMFHYRMLYNSVEKYNWCNSAHRLHKHRQQMDSNFEGMMWYKTFESRDNQACMCSKWPKYLHNWGRNCDMAYTIMNYFSSTRQLSNYLHRCHFWVCFQMTTSNSSNMKIDWEHHSFDRAKCILLRVSMSHSPYRLRKLMSSKWDSWMISGS